MDGGSGGEVERVRADLLADPRQGLEPRLDPGDLNTLLMALSRVRATAVTPSRPMQRWRDDRYVHPSSR